MDKKQVAYILFDPKEHTLQISDPQDIRNWKPKIYNRINTPGDIGTACKDWFMGLEQEEKA